ncbi:MAG: hypothetical protein O7C59_08165 [Rickettsia endosymbiont of Ixodes persulcatus]|nr:hypothetical protein [Rickettsia endosymbiont of Ixodes persulcatus]
MIHIEFYEGKFSTNNLLPVNDIKFIFRNEEGSKKLVKVTPPSINKIRLEYKQKEVSNEFPIFKQDCLILEGVEMC